MTTTLEVDNTLEDLTKTLVQLENFLELEQRRHSKTVTSDMVVLVNTLMDEVQRQKKEKVEA